MFYKVSKFHASTIHSFYDVPVCVNKEFTTFGTINRTFEDGELIYHWLE